MLQIISLDWGKWGTSLDQEVSLSAIMEQQRQIEFFFFFCVNQCSDLTVQGYYFVYDRRK